MKRMLSLLMAMLMLSIFSVTVFAALPADGMITKFVEAADGVVTATVYLKGPIVGGLAATTSIVFDTSVVSMLKKDKTTAGVIGNTQDAMDYINLSAAISANSASYVSDACRIEAVGRIRIGIGTSTQAAFFNVADGVELEIFSFYFKKAGGKTISDATFTYRTDSPTQYGYYNKNSGQDVVQTNEKAATNFDKVVTPYAPATTPEFKWDKSNPVSPSAVTNQITIFAHSLDINGITECGVVFGTTGGPGTAAKEFVAYDTTNTGTSVTGGKFAVQFTDIDQALFEKGEYDLYPYYKTTGGRITDGNTVYTYTVN